MVWTGGSEGRLAKSLIVLYDQVQKSFPANRDRSSDGTIGDASHQAGTSDHNPGPDGVVTALDITNDPAHGLNSRALAEQLVNDPRTKYVISNRQIASGSGQSHPQGEWRPYTGSNPHDLHMHLSVKDPPEGDIDTPWVFTAAHEPGPVTKPSPLARGSTGEGVKLLQEFLFVDGHFGPVTETAVKAFQTKQGITADGVVGPYTWREILKVTGPAPEPVPETGWHAGITATEFGGNSETERSAYDEHRISSTELCVALPFRFAGIRPKVEVKGPAGTAIGTIEDVGPWNINDPYWDSKDRPDAETHNHDHQPLTLEGPNKGKVPTNDAGIDLSPALASAVGVDGKGKVDWRFIT